MLDKFDLSPRSSNAQSTKIRQISKTHLKDAINYYNVSQFVEAIASSNLALQIDLSLAQAYNIKGLSFIKLERYQEAITAFEDAELFSPVTTYIYINKALALYKLGLYDQVIVACTQAIEIDSNLSRAYHGRALAHLAHKHYDAAIEDCLQAIELDSLAHKTYVTKGNIYFELKQYAEASNAYKDAIHLDIKNREVINEKRINLLEEGEMLLQSSCYKEAFLTYDQALFFCVDDAERSSIHKIKGNIMVKQGEKLFELKNYKSASDAFWQAAQCHHFFQNIYANRGNHLYSEGKRLFAQGKYQEAFEPFNNMILFGYKQEEAYIAIMQLKFLLRSYQDIFEAHVRIKEIYKGGKNINEIEEQNILVEAFFQVIRYGYKLIDVYSILINIILYKGNNCFKKKLYAEALLAYKNALSVCNDIEITVKEQSEHTRYHMLKGKIFFKIGDALFALERYKKAILEYKRSSSLHRQISIAYKHTNLFEVSNEIIESLNKKIEICLQHLKNFDNIEVEVDKNKDEEIDYDEIMSVEHKEFRKSRQIFIDEVSDTDDYDENYNQYLRLDLSDEIDKYNER